MKRKYGNETKSNWKRYKSKTKPKAGIAPETKAGLDCMEGVQRGYEGGHQSVIITTTITTTVIIIITPFVYVEETDKTNHDEWRLQERLQGWDAVSRMNNTLGDWERGWQGLRFDIFYEIFFLASILRSTVQSWAQTLPKAQRTRGLSSSYQSNILRSYHKFKHKSHPILSSESRLSIN